MSGCHTACLPPEEPNLCNLKPSHTLHSSQMKECRVFCFTHHSFKHQSFSAVQNHLLSVNSHSLKSPGWLYRIEWNLEVNLSKHIGTTTIFFVRPHISEQSILSPSNALIHCHTMSTGVAGCHRHKKTAALLCASDRPPPSASASPYICLQITPSTLLYI